MARSISCAYSPQTPYEDLLRLSRLQAHISKVFIEDFALVSDSAYVAQNAARIIRALLEIALSRKWANNAILLIDLSKAIERRTWPYEHPLTQITTLQKETLYNLRRWADETEISELREMDVKAVADLIHLNEKHGAAIRDAALAFPTVGFTHSLRPLSHDLLQISILIVPQFTWDARFSGSVEPFYLWVQDEEGINILQWRSVLLRQSTRSVEIDFVVPLADDSPASFTVVSASDRWLGSDEQRLLPLQELVMPQPPPESTPLLDIPYLQISCLQDPQLEDAYRPFVTTLNGIQLQVFWTAYHTQSNVLLSAPVASGKSVLGEMAIWCVDQGKVIAEKS
jgi:antiviral helicase SLH1